MSNTTKIYMTKYAMTTGIKLEEVQIRGDRALPLGRFVWVSYGPGEWFRTYADALENAETRRARKIASLRKQIIAAETRVFMEPLS